MQKTSKDDLPVGENSYQDKDLLDFFNFMKENMEDTPPEITKLVNEHFWELFDE